MTCCTHCRKLKTGSVSRGCWLLMNRPNFMGYFLKLLRHQIAGDARRVAFELRSHRVALLLVEARGLDFERVERDARAAAAAAFLLGHLEHPAADAVAAVVLGQKEAIDAELAEIAAAVEPAQNLAGFRVGYKHRKR